MWSGAQVSPVQPGSGATGNAAGAEASSSADNIFTPAFEAFRDEVRRLSPQEIAEKPVEFFKPYLDAIRKAQAIEDEGERNWALDEIGLQMGPNLEHVVGRLERLVAEETRRREEELQERERPGPLTRREPGSRLTPGPNAQPMGGPEGQQSPAAPGGPEAQGAPAGQEAQTQARNSFVSEINDLRRVATGLGAQMRDMKEGMERLDVANDGRPLQEAESNYNYAKGEENSKRAEKRNYEQQVDAKSNERKNFWNQIKSFADKLEVSRKKLAAAWDLANFYKDKYARDIKNYVAQAVLELSCDIRAGFDEIVRVMHAASMKLLGSMMGVGVSASTMFSPPKDFRVKDAPPDQWSEKMAGVKSQEREYEAEVEQFNKLKADKFYDEQLADAGAKLAKAKAEHGKAAADLSAAEAKKVAETDSYKSYRNRKAGMLSEYNALASRMEAIEEEMREKSASSNATA